MAWIRPSLILSLVALGAVYGTYAQLSEDFYDATCPAMKSIVNTIVTNLPTTENIGAALVRLAFHDCWVRGCDGSVLIQSTSENLAERDAFSNFKLRGITEIDKMKTELEAVCPGIVSCADIIAIAARDAVVELGGTSWNVLLGRRDGRNSFASEADSNLPFPNLNFRGLVANFARKGFSAREMIILSGAHTIGRAHCNAVQPHLYNFTGADNAMDVDPTLKKDFVRQLRRDCPKGEKETVIPEMDKTGDIFDTNYYRRVLTNKGLFTSDAALITDPSGRSIVQELQSHPRRWFVEFAATMLKLSQIGVLTGSEGEIRTNCQILN